MQRSPRETATQGVQKWEPHHKRVELVAAFALNALGEQEIELDSLLIMAQALTKALCLVADDLGPTGLGKVRTNYCLAAFEQLARDAHSGQQALQAERFLS